MFCDMQAPRLSLALSRSAEPGYPSRLSHRSGVGTIANPSLRLPRFHRACPSTALDESAVRRQYNTENLPGQIDARGGPPQRHAGAGQAHRVAGFGSVQRVDALEASRQIYRQLTRLGTATPPAMRAWTGELFGPDDAHATLVLRHPGSLRALLDPLTDLTSGEAYLYDDVDVEGSMLAVMEFGDFLAGDHRHRLRHLQLARLIRHLPEGYRRDEAVRPVMPGRLHSPPRDRRAVTYHYDVGNDFFSLFLDPQMVYSCAYYLDPTEGLDKAQARKLDLICRKLELAPGQQFLDVGCGWGALVNHAAANYGVEATGITLSRPQAEMARQRARQLGLEDRVTVLEADYREVKGNFDAIASVGMFEHVGRRRLAEYFRRLKKLLNPGGQLLNHGIVTRQPQPTKKPSFIGTYVFPDKDLVTVDTTISVAEGAGFELRDAENLRQSYALTLRHWVENLEANATRAVALSDERTFRIWRLYMAGSAVAFGNASIAVWQLVLSDPARPWRYGRRRQLAVDDS